MRTSHSRPGVVARSRPRRRVRSRATRPAAPPARTAACTIPPPPSPKRVKRVRVTYCADHGPSAPVPSPGRYAPPWPGRVASPGGGGQERANEPEGGGSDERPRGWRDRHRERGAGEIAQVLVDGGRCAAALGDRPYDQRLAAAHVA